MWEYYYNNQPELYHHGILGQRWGIRRYQNKDGTLTPAGKKRYLDSDGSITKQFRKDLSKTVVRQQNGRHLNENEIVKEEIQKSNELNSAFKKFEDFESKREKLEKDYYKKEDQYVKKAKQKFKDMDPMDGDFEENMRTSAFVLFMNEHYKGGMNAFVNKRDQVYDSAKKEVEKFANNLLQEYGDKPIATLNKNAAQSLTMGIFIDEFLSSENSNLYNIYKQKR